ncbi:MAG: hypothetical protein IT503_13775 [Burkholderiaceae bacterium]|nr:MAG: hypothetical protein F9K36_01520 [Burkholderiaceae bacterium]MCC7287242.1 hypothetical protein [Burkholderiaceae bacterium]
MPPLTCATALEANHAHANAAMARRHLYTNEIECSINVGISARAAPLGKPADPGARDARAAHLPRTARF